MPLAEIPAFAGMAVHQQKPHRVSPVANDTGFL